MHCFVGGCFDGFRCELCGNELKEDVFCGNGELGFSVWGPGVGNGCRDWGVDSVAAVEADVQGVGEGWDGGEFVEN